MKKYTKLICMIAAVCLLGAAAFCGFRIYSHYAHESEQEEVFEKIAELYATVLNTAMISYSSLFVRVSKRMVLCSS